MEANVKAASFLNEKHVTFFITGKPEVGKVLQILCQSIIMNVHYASCILIIFFLPKYTMLALEPSGFNRISSSLENFCP